MTLIFDHEVNVTFFLLVNATGIHVKFNFLQPIVCEISQFKLQKLKFLNVTKSLLTNTVITIHLVNSDMLNIHVEFHLPRNCQTLVIAPDNFYCSK